VLPRSRLSRHRPLPTRIIRNRPQSDDAHATVAADVGPRQPELRQRARESVALGSQVIGVPLSGLSATPRAPSGE
jgi:hypothetical protein